jgi:hypothetical protein
MWPLTLKLAARPLLQPMGHGLIPFSGTLKIIEKDKEATDPQSVLSVPIQHQRHHRDRWFTFDLK